MRHGKTGLNIAESFIEFALNTVKRTASAEQPPQFAHLLNFRQQYSDAFGIDRMVEAPVALIAFGASFDFTEDAVVTLKVLAQRSAIDFVGRLGDHVVDLDVCIKLLLGACRLTLFHSKQKNSAVISQSRIARHLLPEIRQ